MARSILPSRARKSARADLSIVHRTYRRTVAQKLHTDCRAVDVDVDELFDLGDHTRYPNHEIREIVLDRRLADTLNHFERWAVAVTRNVPVEDRLSTLRSWLPAGMIGAHAESHLRWIPEIHPRGEHELPGFGYRSQLAGERDTTRQALLRVLADGLHAELNRHLRRAYSSRLLLGVHDLDAFVVEMVNCSRHRCGTYCDHPTLDALRQFMRMIV
jgi:hypothetical protein